MLMEAEEWEEVQVGSLLSGQEGPKCGARRGQKREKSNGKPEEKRLLFCPAVGEPSACRNQMQKRGRGTL